MHKKIIQDLIAVRFERDIVTIKQTITNEMGENLISIYLYGGYGRDEGSWLIDNDVIKPYNDYDIALIVKNKIANEEVKFLENLLKNKIDIKWIDITQYTIQNLETLHVSIKNYDLKYASKFLYGDKEILQYIQHMKSTEIPLKDIQTLFFTRLWTLLGSFDINGLKVMNREKEIFFRNQMAKCILAIVDCVLLQYQSYDASYQIRVEKLSNYSTDNNLLTMSKWALSEKLFPKYENMSEFEILKLYKNVNKLFFNYFFTGLEKYWNRPIKTCKDVKNYILYSPINFLKRVFFVIKSRNLHSEKIILLGILQCYVANIYVDLDKQDDYTLKLIKQLLFKSFNVDISDIDEIRIFIANTRIDL